MKDGDGDSKFKSADGAAEGTCCDNQLKADCNKDWSDEKSGEGEGEKKDAGEKKADGEHKGHDHSKKDDGEKKKDDKKKDDKKDSAGESFGVFVIFAGILSAFFA